MIKFIALLFLVLGFSAHADLTPYVGSGQVDSVNGGTGIVVLTTSAIAEGSNLYYTDARSKNACVENSITTGHTTIAPSGDAVFTALALKQTTAYTPTLASNWATAPTTVAGALDSLVVLQQSAVGSQPACASNHRGLQWLVQGGAGVADIYQVCQKDSSDVYGWVTH